MYLKSRKVYKNPPIEYSMNVATRVFKNSLYTYFGYFIGGIITFILNVAIARYLGVSLFGDYSFVFAFISFFTIVANFGLDVIGIREMSHDIKIAKKIISTSLVLRTILSILAIFLAVITIYFMPVNEVIERGVILASISLLFYSLSLSCISFFLTKLEMIYFFLSETISKILYAFMIFIVFWKNLGYLALISCYVLMTFFQFLISYYFIKRKIKISWKMDKDIAKYLIKESWPLAIMLILASIYFRIDTIMLNFMKTSADVGYYSAAYTFAQGFTIIATAIAGSLFPLLSKNWKKSRRNFKKILSISVKYISIIAIPISFAFTIRAKEIIPLIYGNQYLSSILSFQILLWATLLIFFTSLFDNAVISTGRQKLTTIVALTTVIINIMLNFLLIPKYGIEGAAFATVVSEATNVLLFGIYLSKYCSLKIDKLHKILIATLLSNIFIFLNMNIIIDLIFVCLSYITLLYMLKVFREDEKTMIKNALLGTLEI